MIVTTPADSSFANRALFYLERLQGSFSKSNLESIESLANALRLAWIKGKNVYICGNGGSAANAIHIANDLHYGVGSCGSGPKLPGIRVEALPSNIGIITCLANDTGYENIYSYQLEVKGREGDLLIALSGSGNSPNIVRVLEKARLMNIKSFGILAYTGGKCKSLVDIPIHFEVDDMQVAEDTQLIVGHLCMQWLNSHKPDQLEPLDNG